MNMKRTFAVITAAVMLFSFSPAVFGEELISFSVEKETAPVANPHKGWVQYVYSDWDITSPKIGIKSNPTWKFTNVVYTRFPWSDIETSKGVYDWSKVEKMAEFCAENGKTFAFGIIPCDSSADCKDGYVPQYVYDEGCEYVIAKTSSFYSEDGVQRVPVWSDEIYISAVERLAQAVAEKYDGDHRIEFIDIRSLGNWGEWHTYGLEGSEMPSVDVQKQYIKIWSDAFDHTLLALNVNDERYSETAEYAVSLGMTLRRDGLVGIEGCEKYLAPAYEAKLPTIGETCYGYTYLRDNGKWTDNKLTKAVRGGHLTYMALAGGVYDGYEMYKERTTAVTTLQNELGYNFVVKSASVAYDNGKAVITLKIKNEGLDTQHFDMRLKIAATDKKGRNAREICGKSFLIKSGSFEAGKTKVYTFTTNADKIPEGAYLAAGLSDESGCTVRFGNKHTSSNGYLILGKAR